MRAQLREEGYEAIGLETVEEAEGELATSAPRPAALVFDTSETSVAEVEPKLIALAGRLPVMVVAAATEEFDSASVQLLRRPVQIQDVVAAVRSAVARLP